MENERDIQKPSPDGDDQSLNYEAPEIVKLGVLVDLTANISGTPPQ